MKTHFNEEYDNNAVIKKITNHIQNEIGFESLKNQGLFYIKKEGYDKALFYLLLSVSYEEETPEILFSVSHLYYQIGENKLYESKTSPNKDKLELNSISSFESALKYVNKINRTAFKPEQRLELKRKIIEKLKQLKEK